MAHGLRWLAAAALLTLTPATLMAFALRAPIPEIAEGLTGSFAEGGDTFDRRIREAFPVGSPQQTMLKNLAQLGFTISEDSGFATARFERAGLFCRRLWIVRSDADETGGITVAEGNYGQSCVARPQIESYARG